MKIDPHCKRLALLDLLFKEDSHELGLHYHELLHLWPRTGLRRNDLDDALATALARGDLDERDIGGERLIVRTAQGIAARGGGGQRVSQLQLDAQAMDTLRWARQRRRQGSRLGRRRDDPRMFP